MIDLLKLEAHEAERIAYAEGLMTAELFARIAELEAEQDALAKELENAREDAVNDSLKEWERENGPAEAYKQFFLDCFARLAGEYPCPSITSDYDKSVIFAAIDKGEACEQ